MSFDTDKLYALLPAVHRLRDAQQGEPLRQLLDLLADQVAVLEEELDQLYDNHFVETAAPWAASARKSSQRIDRPLPRAS